jgi:hypothetical protein
MSNLLLAVAITLSLGEQPEKVQGPIKDNVEKLVTAGDRWVATAEARIVELETKLTDAAEEVKSKLTWAIGAIVAAILGHRPADNAVSWAAGKVTGKKEKL